MAKNGGILNPFEVTESTTLAVQSTVDKNKYFTILVFRQHYTNLDTCPKVQPYERVHENRLRSIVSICEEQFGFVKGKSTTDVIFVLRQLQERYREGQQYLHCVYALIWKKKLRQSSYGRTVSAHARREVSEHCIRLVKNMYHQCESVVRCAARTSEPFAVGVGLHQGSAFSPFLFSIMMDSLTEKCTLADDVRR